MSDNVHKGRRERTRQKFLKTGFTGFADHEKLELLLFYAISVKDVNPLAHNLLTKFHTISGVFDASVEQLMQVDGIGENTAILIKLLPELSKEYFLSKNTRVALDSFDAVCDFFKTQFIGLRNEVIKVACLDDNLRLIACEDIEEGTPGSVYVDIRKLVKFTYFHNSENIIIAHNHPNGDAVPSNDDLKTTADIFKKLKAVGIELVDHIVVAKGQATSIKKVGGFSMLK
ncbi:MAG: DNA repair protein RadC [Oscillospiraceae bacterium]|nr:DNA repair protein RadC [Oscillospiraceae bacterium]